MDDHPAAEKKHALDPATRAKDITQNIFKSEIKGDQPFEAMVFSIHMYNIS